MSTGRTDRAEQAGRSAPGLAVVAAQAFSRHRDGDSSAMDRLVDDVTPLLWHTARSQGADRGTAEDVVQTTWLALVRSHESVADPQAISGWLTVTARREAWRVAKQHRIATATADEVLGPMLPHEQSTEEHVADADEAARLWTALATLTDRCQRLLRVVAFDDRPDYARIAADLDMPIGSIGPTRQRCLAKLRTALVDAGGAR